jgi:hypothetical protein
LGIQVLIGAGNFSPHDHTHTGSGVHPASYPMGTRVLSLGVKQLSCEADHSPPSSTEIRMCGAIPPLPKYAFMAWCSVKRKAESFQYNAVRNTNAITLKIKHRIFLKRCNMQNQTNKQSNTSFSLGKEKIKSWCSFPLLVLGSLHY